MNFMFATSSSPPHLQKPVHPPSSSPPGPNLGSFSPIPRTPSRHRQYKNRDFSSPTPAQDNPRRAFLREQFKKRCFERAQKARHDQVRNRRTSSSALSSDGFDFDDDAKMEERENQDAEDDVLNDEVWKLFPFFSFTGVHRRRALVQLFRRIMASARHKQQHNFRLSYQLEVGSSVDPDMEDISRWENELQGLASLLRRPSEQSPLILHSYSFPTEKSSRSHGRYSRRL